MKYIQSKLAPFALAACVAVLSACGGGGGSAGNTGGGITPTPGASGTTPTPGGSGTTPIASPTLTLSIVNSSGNNVNTITAGGGSLAKATLKKADGTVAEGVKVVFSLSDSMAKLTPTSKLTDASGIASVTIAPLTIGSSGASSLTANATVDGKEVKASIDFESQPTNVSLSALTATNTNLPTAGTTALSATALINGTPAVGVPVDINFGATCGKINGLDAASGGVSIAVDGNGMASPSYTAVKADGSSCVGGVTVTARASTSTSQQLALQVAAPTASQLNFLGANPPSIFIADSGAADQSILKFKVLSSLNQPLPNTKVKLSIITNPGNTVSFGTLGNTAPVPAESDNSGEVSVKVFAGSIPGPVKLRAELVSNAGIFSESQNFTVASGPPSQRFISLSVEKSSIEGWTIDGASTALVARIADRQGNPVEDGTTINFTAEGGQVAPSCATKRNAAGHSECQVQFISQNPRPSNGRVSVMAYTEGTKDYDDLNGNNKYDAGDVLKDIGDAFRDDNENQQFDQGEFVVPRDGKLACPGVGGAFPARANTCDGTLKTTVRQQTVILFASSFAALTNVVANTAQVSFNVASAEHLLLPMPAGTTISAEADDRTPGSQIRVGTNPDGTAKMQDTNCTIGRQPPSPLVPGAPTVGNPNENISTPTAVGLKDCTAGDQVLIKVTSPGASGVAASVSNFVITIR